MPSIDQMGAAMASLKASHAAGRLAHAYLIIGSPRGEGLVFARAAASFVLCKDFAPPCGHCVACRQVEARTHADVLWLEPEKKSRIIGIEPVREACGQLAQKSYEGGWKVAILLHADRLNQEGANAFLKTLEEPPPRTLILLVTDSPQAMLATILSRCQRIHLGAGDHPVSQSWSPALLDLLAQPVGAGALDRISRARQLQSLLEVERKRIEKEVDAELRKSDDAPDKEVRDARVETQARQIRADMLHTMLLWQRDVLLLASGGDPLLLHFPDREPVIRDQLGRNSSAAAANALRGLEGLIRRLDRNVKPEALAYEAYLLDSAN